MHQLASPGPDGNSGAMGGNSGFDGETGQDPARTEVSYGPGGWKSPKSSGVIDIDRRNG